MEKLTIIDKLLLDTMIHIDPNFLLEPDKYITDPKTLDKEKLQKYYHLISAIQYAYKKTQRYPTYFAEFYPNSENIPDFEALEHHLHAYLNDLTILKNKLEVFLNSLKNDLKKAALSKEDISSAEAIKDITEQTLKTFDNVKKYRDPHHHKGTKYLDPDILQSELSTNVLKDNHPFKDILTNEAKEHFKKKKLESFEKGKNHRIQQAEENNKQISGLLDTLFRGLEKHLYEFLGIKHTTDLLVSKKEADSSKNLEE